jgi:hypothetical protein
MEINSGHERPFARLGEAFSFSTSLWCMVKRSKRAKRTCCKVRQLRQSSSF